MPVEVVWVVCCRVSSPAYTIGPSLSSMSSYTFVVGTVWLLVCVCVCKLGINEQKAERGHRESMRQTILSGTWRKKKIYVSSFFLLAYIFIYLAVRASSDTQWAVQDVTCSPPAAGLCQGRTRYI